MADAEPRRQAHAVTDDHAAIAARVFEAFANRDLGTVLKLADREIELFVPGTATLAQGGRAYRGHNGVVKYFHDVARMWDELEVIPQRYEKRRQYVVVTGRLRARREGSFLIDEPAVWVFKIRDGKVLRARAHTDRDAALAEAGFGSGKRSV
jgi:ketosteroid isomerase-like protein